MITASNMKSMARPYMLCMNPEGRSRKAEVYELHQAGSLDVFLYLTFIKSHFTRHASSDESPSRYRSAVAYSS